MTGTPRDPSPTPWLITAGVVAYGVGSLFRAYKTTGVSLYRMFGTFGIVVIGYLGIRAFAAATTAEGRQKLRTALDKLPEGFLLVPAVALTDSRGRKTPVEYLIVGRGAVHLLAVDETPAHVRPAATRQRRQRVAARLWTAYKRCHQLLKGRDSRGYTVQPAMLVTLRQDTDEIIEGMPLVAPDDLPNYLMTADQAPDPLESTRSAQPSSQDQLRLHVFFADML